MLQSFSNFLLHSFSKSCMKASASMQASAKPQASVIPLAGDESARSARQKLITADLLDKVAIFFPSGPCEIHKPASAKAASRTDGRMGEKLDGV